MKSRKRIICLLLCLVVLLSITGCGASESTAETASPADPYLAMAEEFVSQEKYDSALDVLNQSKTEMDDPRLDAMIAEIQASRPVFLELEYACNDDNLVTGIVQVHGVTAQVFEKTVCYTVEYTAPEGMYLQIMGTGLDRCWDYLTPGGKDSFVFELDRETAKNHFSALTVLFKYSSMDYLQLDITARWPEETPETLVEIPMAVSGNPNCSFDLATVRAIGEDLLHFHVAYTTPLDQQYVAGLSFSESEEDIFFSVGTAAGEDMVSFMVDRKDMETIDTISLRLCPYGEEKNTLAAMLHTSDYTLPESPVSAVIQELTIDNTDNTAFPVENAEGKSLRVDNILVQQTPSGSLYSLKGDFSESTVNTAYCAIGRLAYTVTMLVDDPAELQFFVPAEIMTKAVDMRIEFWGQDGFVAYMPMTCDYTPVSVNVLRPEKCSETAAEAPAPGQFVQHPYWSWQNNLTNSEVEILDVTETVLDNGNTRFTLEYRATAGMKITAFDPPNGELYRAAQEKETSGRKEYFTFEVEKSIMDQLQYITLNFWSENDGGNYFVYLENNLYQAMVTEGNPVGEAQTLDATTRGKVKVHSVKAQQLDNGYVRYTVEYTTTAGLHVSFLNQPYNDRFLYLSEQTATGEQDTYVVDILQSDNDAISEITMKFYDPAVGSQIYAWFKPAEF